MTNTTTQIERAIERLEINIARQQSYIAKHGESNDAGEYDEQWEEYKNDAEYNLKKLDSLKAIKTTEEYKAAPGTDLIPVEIRFQDDSTEIILIPKNELYYTAGVYSGHRSSGFRLDFAVDAVHKRGLYPSGVSYPFI